jgi:hypothetical protein
MKTTDVQNLVQIQGIVLTPRAIEVMNAMQDEDNSTIKMLMESIADAVCYIAVQPAIENDCEKKEQILANLCNTRNWLKDLKKP